MKIAHLSDIHFGRIAHPGIVDDLVRDVNNARVDLVAISGDLTQRAVHNQFKECLKMFERFEAPLLVVPGNHDVFPWWKPIRRLYSPLSRFKKYMGVDMVRSYEAKGVAILGINSAHGKTIKGGKIAPEVSDAIESYFSDRESSEFKILMLHHHLIQLDALMPHDLIIDSEKHFDVVVRSGVNLVLCGHMHISHVESLDGEWERPFVVASAGTATSNRGRRSNRRKNYYNIIEVTEEEFTIYERTYLSRERKYKIEKTTCFERT